MLERDLQAVAQEADEDVRFDTIVFLVVDRADVEVVLEFLEGLLDFGEHDVLLPEFFRVFGDEVGAQQVGAFASAGFAQLLAVELEGEGVGGDGFVLSGQVDVDEPPGVAGLFLGRPEPQKQGIALRVFHAADLVQALPESLEPAAAHGLFLVAPSAAAGEHVEVFVGAGELDFDLVLHFSPGFGEELFFELGQPSARGADEVACAFVAHLFERLLGGDAAIHDPQPVLFPILLFDFPEEPRQRCFIRCVSGHDLVGDGKAFGGDDQRDDHLHAIGSLVAAVAEALQPRMFFLLLKLEM